MDLNPESIVQQSQALDLYATAAPCMTMKLVRKYDALWWLVLPVNSEIWKAVLNNHREQHLANKRLQFSF